MYLLLKSLNFNLHPFPTADTNCVMKRDSIPEAIQHKPFRTDSRSCSPVGGDGDEVNSTPRAYICHRKLRNEIYSLGECRCAVDEELHSCEKICEYEAYWRALGVGDNEFLLLRLSSHILSRYSILS